MTQAEEVVRSQTQETIKYQQEEIVETQAEGVVKSQIQEIKAIVNKSHKKHKIVANREQIKTITNNRINKMQESMRPSNLLYKKLTKTEIIGMSIKKLSSENNKM